MTVETVVVWILAFRYFQSLPKGGAPGSEPPPTLAEMWHFSWPLIPNQSAEMGVVFIINVFLNVFLGRLTHPDLALAAFGVMYGLISLLFSPARNLLQTAQTLARTPADAGVLVRFTAQLTGVLALVSIVLFSTPLQESALIGVMGLGDNLYRYCLPAMELAFLMAGAWSFSALFRGLMAGARNTATLALTGGARLLVAVAACLLVAPETNGVLLGFWVWVLGYVIEIAILVCFRHRARKEERSWGM